MLLFQSSKVKQALGCVFGFSVSWELQQPLEAPGNGLLWDGLVGRALIQDECWSLEGKGDFHP